MKPVNTICIVDDDKIFQFLIKKQIENKKLANNVITFSDGEEAISFFREAINSDPNILPDIILLDLNLPTMDGWDFLEGFLVLKPKLPKKIHIYVVSAFMNLSDIDRVMKLKEVSDYMVKPITDQMLIDIVGNLEVLEQKSVI